MRKSLVAIFVLVLAVSLTVTAFAQENKLAFFAIDSDLGTAGYQGGRVVDGIGGGKRVGFAIYVKNVDQLRSVVVDFTWDGEKAARSGSDSGFNIDLDDRNVNGVDVTASEENVLGSSVSGVGEVDEAGHYTITFAKLGGDAVATTDFGLVYCLILKTASDFTTDDSFAVTAKVSVLNDAGIQKELGQADFYVNGAVDVKTSTWGEIKSQFRD